MRLLLSIGFILLTTIGFSQSDVAVVKVRKPDNIEAIGKNWSPDLNLQATYGGKISGKVRPGDLVYDGIIIMMGEVIDRSAKVTSFNMKVYSRGRDLIKLRAKGPMLTNAMIKMLSRLRPYDFLYFDEIKVRMSDGVVRKFPSIVFEVY